MCCKDSNIFKMPVSRPSSPTKRTTVPNRRQRAAPYSPMHRDYEERATKRQDYGIDKPVRTRIYTPHWHGDNAVNRDEPVICSDFSCSYWGKL
jgi:hypothetical protein